MSDLFDVFYYFAFNILNILVDGPMQNMSVVQLFKSHVQSGMRNKQGVVTSFMPYIHRKEVFSKTECYQGYM